MDMDMQLDLCMASSMVHAPMNFGHPHQRPSAMLGVKPDPCNVKGMLNFSISGSDDYDIPQKKSRASRDPMSHRIIEKRRRDRMNNCLADLSQLIPSNYMKQGQGRIEKTEIIEMAIKHIKLLQAQCVDKTKGSLAEGACCADKFYMGYKECMDEVMRCLVEKQGYNAGDKISVNLLQHLQEQGQRFVPEKQFQSIGDQLSDLPHDNSNSTRPSSSLTNVDEGFVGESLEMSAGMMSELLNQESLAACSANKDAHLRTLLNNEKHTNGIFDESENSFYSYRNDMRGDKAFSHDTSSTTAEMMARRDCSDAKGAYKFKNDIKLRFSADMSSETDKKSESPNGSDSASNSSQEDQSAKIHEERSQMPSPTSDSTSTPYPSSEHSSSGNGKSCNGEHSSVTNMSANISETTGSLTNSVPGFAMHPGGSYYIPMVIHTTHLMPYLRSESAMGNMGVCHPISIPVSFGGPFIAMQNIRIGATSTGAPFIPKHEPTLPHHVRPRKRKEQHS